MPDDKRIVPDDRSPEVSLHGGTDVNEAVGGSQNRPGNPSFAGRHQDPRCRRCRGRGAEMLNKHDGAISKFSDRERNGVRCEICFRNDDGLCVTYDSPNSCERYWARQRQRRPR